MGQKIHPVGFRLGITKTLFALVCASNYPETLKEDFKLRRYIGKSWVGLPLIMLEFLKYGLNAKQIKLN